MVTWTGAENMPPAGLMTGVNVYCRGVGLGAGVPEGLGELLGDGFGDPLGVGLEVGIGWVVTVLGR